MDIGAKVKTLLASKKAESLHPLLVGRKGQVGKDTLKREIHPDKIFILRKNNQSGKRKAIF
ncbi:MAG: hypothetical protein ACTSR1_01160 [Candidatus Heimdallarchaeota archaeon]